MLTANDSSYFSCHVKDLLAWVIQPVLDISMPIEELEMSLIFLLLLRVSRFSLGNILIDEK